MVDIFRQYAPSPFNLAPAVYPPLSRMPDVWKLGYQISDGPKRANMVYNAIWPYVRRSIHRLIHENPCDLIVSVHPLINAPVLRALRKDSIPYITVVTDMVSTHAAWYNPHADLVVVPTAAAKERAVKVGLNADKVQVVGLPVADRFCQPAGDKLELRKKLGWPEDRPVVLLVGGGEGMGPLEQVARAIESRRPNATLVVITGRNRKLKTALEEHKWNIPTFVYGFVREMPDFMRAADILVTKAGPGTICEAFIAGLPIILYSKMPGQEDGNVTYVVQEGAGIWAPDPKQVADAVCHWFNEPAAREKAAANCMRVARPTAAREIARILANAASRKAAAD
jgi:1,2-diacylglycerol 3-beta-galactosyltransferase